MQPFPEDFRTVLADAAESTLIALLSPGQAPPSAEDIHEALATAGLSVSEVLEPDDADDPNPSGLRWLIDLHFEPSAALQGWARVWLEAAPAGGYGDLEQHMEAQDLPAIADAEWQLGMTFALGSDALHGFHRQLKLLDAAAPDAVLLLDADSCRPRPAGWLKDAAESSLPPPAASLYSIHAVTDDEQQLWLHTHGLHRAGCPDLDLICVPEQAAEQGAALINHVAALFLEGPVPAPGEPFSIGRDLELVWLPWDAALEHLAPSSLGAATDREDESHTGIRGVLFAPTKSGLSSTQQHLLTLASRPQLYLSEQAAERQVLLASERLTRFLSLLEAHHADAAWEFLVQLRSDGERDAPPELLWYRAHGMLSGQVDASLSQGAETHARTLDAAHARTLDEAHARTLDAAHARTLDEAHARTLNEAHARTLDEAHARTLDEAHARTLDEAHARTLDEAHAEAHAEASSQRGLRSLDRLTDWAIVSPFGRFTPENVLSLERRLQRDLTLN